MLGRATVFRAFAVVSLALLAVATTIEGQEPEALTVTPDFAADAWVDPGQQIGLRLSRPLNLQTERLAVMIGRTDLSALFFVTPTVARYSANTLPLASGESEIVVYLVPTGAPAPSSGRTGS